MTWRDNPAIVWQDDDEDRIELVGGFLAAVETDRCMGYESGIDVTAPVSVEERVEATERWLAALGLTADDIRELPRPVGVGDTVAVEGRSGVHVVRAIDGDIALLRRGISGQPMVASIENLRHTDEPEADVERSQLAADRDRYKEAFAQLVNEIGEHVEWLRDWETDPDMSPHRAAAELESVIDDIMREEGIDDDE